MDGDLGALYELTSSPEVAACVRDQIRQYLLSDASEFAAEDDFIVVELAVSEAVTNVCKHAYKGELDRPIWFLINHEGPDLEMTLRHLGEPPQLDQIPPPNFDGSKESGFGMFIIERCMDEVHYGVDADDKAYVCLRKTLGRGPGSNETQN